LHLGAFGDPDEHESLDESSDDDDSEEATSEEDAALELELEEA
jgi:hypothetical protein